ncbi:DNA methyltransferase [Sphaerisporangium sp. NPDC088356]|uniref:Eco57I restriction-modification methylase domain-containing protein n=1 Tax=Sphaerisporangium sp. NPDC088356 TaxID=3154871 RepID=UPI0034399EF6
MRYASDFSHQNWLSLVEVSGPFLSLPVLRRTWPDLDSLNKKEREQLRMAHTAWQQSGARREWISYVLRGLLRYGDAVQIGGLDHLAMEVPEHDTSVTPAFALAVPGEEVKVDNVRLFGMITTGHPTARMKPSAWAATPVDRVAQLCRHHGVELGLVTNGRWWALVWAPRGGVTTTAVFDAIPWPESAEREVLRAFVSLLNIERFFDVPEAERLPALLAASLDSQEDITEALGVQVRQAVELLVTAVGRAGVPDEVGAHEVYRGSVAVMMRIILLLFAEERGLLPADNEIYAASYSAGRLCAQLEQSAIEGSEEELENSHAAWHRLLALFQAVYYGVDHPQLHMAPHDGSLFDPDVNSWMPLTIDDRTVLNMLRAVQYIEVGTGRNRERRKLSFRTLDVEQIGYVYEGLLSYEGFRAADTVVGLVGKPGREEEIDLADLEKVAREVAAEVAQRIYAAPVPGHDSIVETLAEKLAERFKDSGIGSPAALRKRLAPLDEAGSLEATRKLLAATDGDADLAQRLLPFAGIIREDLRGLPLVILPGTLYVTESALRKNTGTHYTPRFLAEQVAEGALEPLVYSPGPLQTADRSKWNLRSSSEILGLKIADIAVGSAAFLVAAARYLGDKLVEAWSLEGRQEASLYLEGAEERRADADADPLVIEARRQIIEHCLYGVDINPMAVEMAKLSLWLVSMDTTRPFTFVDDRLVAGDALLGITSIEQLEYMHLKPERGRKIHTDLLNLAGDVRRVVADAAKKRRSLVEIPLGKDPLATLTIKRSVLFEVENDTRLHHLFADLLVGAFLTYAAEQGRLGNVDVPEVQEKTRGFDRASLQAANIAGAVVKGEPGSMPESEERRKVWLAADHVPGNFDRQPLHWPLVFPEVFEKGGFDAIIGNPPFLGGKKISGAMGSNYREYLVESSGRGAKGVADLVAYFALRAHDLLSVDGQSGLIATNTLAQGDTREVGLDQIVGNGTTIRQCIKSRPWPSKSAVLEYCALWTSKAQLGDSAERLADNLVVSEISPALERASRALGGPYRLIGSRRIAHIGSYVNGMGFTMTPENARILIDGDERNREVLFPYINGQNVSSRPDCSASRWIIDFRDWPVERAKEYSECYDQVLRLVKPERDGISRKVYRERWWQYAESQMTMRNAIAGLERVIVITLVSKAVMPMMVRTGQVFSHALGVFATDDTAMLALLSSAPHYWWTLTRASTLETRVRYTPSDVFETLPLPELSPEMRELGGELDTYRRDLMLARQAGLTATYNLVHDPKCEDEDIVELRRIHKAIDEAVCRAYGWDDLIDQLDHGHHDLGRETRYTVGPFARRELVDRLLELNHARYAEEVKQGLHDKTKKKGSKPKASQGPQQLITGMEEGQI